MIRTAVLSGLIAAVSSSSACSANPGCAGLAGDCCPTPSGVALACCGAGPTNPTPAPPAPPATTTTLKFFFGSQCPPCRAFGKGDFARLYNDFQDDASIEWDLDPAVRDRTNGCVDEDNCDFEKATLCAFNMTDTAGQVAWLGCVDEDDGEDPSQVAESCAKQQKLDFDKLNACFSGSQADELLEHAQDVYNTAVPGHGYIPHVFVNDQEWMGQNSPNYRGIKNALCAAGSTAAVCKTTEILACPN